MQFTPNTSVIFTEDQLKSLYDALEPSTRAPSVDVALFALRVRASLSDRIEGATRGH